MFRNIVEHPKQRESYEEPEGKSLILFHRNDN